MILHTAAQHINGHGSVTTQHESQQVVQRQSHTVEMEYRTHERHVIQQTQVKVDGEMDDVVHHVQQLQ